MIIDRNRQPLPLPLWFDRYNRWWRHQGTCAIPPPEL